MSKLALEYNLSDNGLRKICKKHEIPLPLLGHWQKIQYNKEVKIKSGKLTIEGKHTARLLK